MRLRDYSRGKSFLIRLGRIIALSIRGFSEDKCKFRASALTYYSLLSIVQMPSGIPVAAMAVGKAGAGNAAIFAAQILGRKYEPIAESLGKYKQELAAKVEKKAERLEKSGIDNYLETM